MFLRERIKNEHAIESYKKILSDITPLTHPVRE